LDLKTKGWKRHQFLDAIYLSGRTEQHASVAGISDALALWDKAQAAVTQPHRFAFSASQQLGFDLLKKRMVEGRFFGLPASLCNFVRFHRDVSDPVPDSPKLSDVLALAGCDDLVGPVDIDSDLEFFKVVNATPSRRFLVQPWDLGRKPHVLRVSRYSRLPDIRHVVLFAPTGEIGNLDLEFICSSSFVDVWQTLVTWGQIHMGSSVCLRESVVRAVLDSFHTMPLGLPPVSDVVQPSVDDEDGLDEPSVGSSVDNVAKPLLEIAKRGGIVEDGKYVKVFNDCPGIARSLSCNASACPRLLCFVLPRIVWLACRPRASQLKQLVVCLLWLSCCF